MATAQHLRGRNLTPEGGTNSHDGEGGLLPGRVQPRIVLQEIIDSGTAITSTRGQREVFRLLPDVVSGHRIRGSQCTVPIKLTVTLPREASTLAGITSLDAARTLSASVALPPRYFTPLNPDSLVWFLVHPASDRVPAACCLVWPQIERRGAAASLTFPALAGFANPHCSRPIGGPRTVYLVGVAASRV